MFFWVRNEGLCYGMAAEAEGTGTNEIQEVRFGDEPLELMKASLFQCGADRTDPQTQ